MSFNAPKGSTYIVTKEKVITATPAPTFQRPEGLYLHCHLSPPRPPPPKRSRSFNAPKGSTYIVTRGPSGRNGPGNGACCVTFQRPEGLYLHCHGGTGQLPTSDEMLGEFQRPEGLYLHCHIWVYDKGASIFGRPVFQRPEGLYLHCHLKKQLP
mgnify:CR=1 FL=1